MYDLDDDLDDDLTLMEEYYIALRKAARSLAEAIDKRKEGKNSEEESELYVSTTSSG